MKGAHFPRSPIDKQTDLLRFYPQQCEINSRCCVNSPQRSFSRLWHHVSGRCLLVAQKNLISLDRMRCGRDSPLRSRDVRRSYTHTPLIIKMKLPRGQVMLFIIFIWSLGVCRSRTHEKAKVLSDLLPKPHTHAHALWQHSCQIWRKTGAHN
jgi:hypothetical protein